MAGKETDPLLRIAALLKKIGDASSPGQFEPGKSTFREGAAERLQKKLEAGQQAKKALSSDRKEVSEAQDAVKGKTYEPPKDPDKLKNNINRRIKRNTTPDWLPKDDIQSTEVAQFYQNISDLPPALQSDANILYAEATRLYWSTKWNELPKAAAAEARATIEATLTRVQEIAKTDETYSMYRLPETDQLWEGIDASYDIYRTKPIPLPDRQDTSTLESEVKNLRDKKSKTDDERRQLDERQRELSEARAKNNLITNLEKKLSEAQREADLAELSENAHNELAQLRGLRKDLISKSGGDKPAYNQEYAELYVKRLNQRISTLESRINEGRQASQRGEARGYRADNMERQRARLFEISQRAHSARLREAAKRLLEEDMDLAAYENLYKQLQDLEQKAGYWDDIQRDKWSRKFAAEHQKDPNTDPSTVTVSNEDIRPEAQEDKKLLQEMFQIVGERTYVKGSTIPGHSAWAEGHRAHRFIDRMKRFTNDHEGEGALHGVNLTELDEVLFTLTKNADLKPNQAYRDAIGLYEQSDIANFFVMLEQRLHELKIPEAQINEIIQRYTRLENAKEAVHNIIYMYHVGDIESLAKFAPSLPAGDIDLLYKAVPGIKLGQHAREFALKEVIATHKYVPGWFTDYKQSAAGGEGIEATKGGVAWDTRSREVFDSYADAEIAGAEKLTEWQISNALEFAQAIDVLDLRFSEIITDAKGGAFYASSGADKFRVDPIDGIFIKFKVPKPAVSIFYLAVSGDMQTARRIWKEKWSIKEVLKQLHATEADQDSVYGRRITEFRNMLDISGRWGPRSGWGQLRSGERLSREEFTNRGLGLELNLIRGVVAEREEKKIRGRLEVQGKSGAELSILVKREMRTEHVRHEIARLAYEETYKIVEHTSRKLPLVIVRRMATDRAGSRFSEARLKMLDEVLGDGMLRDESGAIITINPTGTASVQIENFATLEKYYPENKGGLMADPESHLVQRDNDLIKAKWAQFDTAMKQVEGDVSVAQQSAVASGHEAINGEDWAAVDRAIRKGNPGMTDAQVQLRVAQAQKYVELIQNAAAAGGSGFDSPQESMSFLAHLSKRIVNNEERFTLTTEDTQWDKLDWDRMGKNGLERGLGDTLAAIKGGKDGMFAYLETLRGEPNIDEMAGVLRKEVFNPIAMYDDGAAQAFCWRVALGTLRYYAEKDGYSYSGPIGDIFNIGLVQNQFARWGKEEWLSSLNKALADPMGESWGPNERNRFIHTLNGLHVFAKDNLAPFGDEGHAYTAHELEDKTGSRPINIAGEWGSYAVISAPVIVAALSAKESLDEENKRG